jgi:hypothetical protein
VTDDDMTPTLDFGDGVTGTWTCWEPDRDLNPQYDGLPDVARWGLILSHPRDDAPDGQCRGGITFDGDVQRQLAADRPRWVVEQWEPLTLSPSILCDCGFHGYIRDGRWVPA